MDLESECQESVAIQFEWTVRGLQKLFDSTKGETKSKVTKSAKFGGGRWQVRSDSVWWQSFAVDILIFRSFSMPMPGQQKKEARMAVVMSVFIYHARYAGNTLKGKIHL
jgi:hypothetical protein